MGSMCVVLCIRDGHTDRYSRSGGGGTLGDVLYKDSKVGPKSFVLIWCDFFLGRYVFFERNRTESARSVWASVAS